MKLIIIYTGYNQRAVIAFMRLAKAINLPVALIAKSPEDTIFLTDYKSDVFITRANPRLDVETIIEHVSLAREKFGCESIFILPTTEFLNRTMLANRTILKDHGIQFGLCEEELYCKLSDKVRFTEFCRSYNIPVPQESEEPFGEFPQVAKPKHYLSDNYALKPVILNTLKDLEILSATGKMDSYFFQPYITGSSIYLLFYFKRDGSVRVYSQENLLQEPDGGSIILAKSSTHFEELSVVKEYEKMLRESGFFGLVMVELRIHNSIPYMIEANPRFWGPSQLVIDSNMKLLEDFLIDNQLCTFDFPDKPYKNSVYYFWSGGMRNAYLAEKEVKHHQFQSDSFIRDYSTLLESEVYFRNDTIKVYYNENK
ncbi:MAG: hypothetical protein ACKOZM_04620 [Flavobacteriales bacterium]